ncbi:protein mono-ADP-ribosyltransferase PARP14-like [Amphiura filiformis]|uniref:protein mono-ADP-ribosyltransferase PARP14-like n=1 Tax=Amphiura filiformis TaxID=82378 RepID=UPI003B218FDE
MANTLDITVRGIDIGRCDRDRLENKLIIHCQRIVSKNGSKCDIEILQVVENKADCSLRFTLKFTDADGIYENEVQAVDRAITSCESVHESTLSIDENRGIPFAITRSCNRIRQETPGTRSRSSAGHLRLRHPETTMASPEQHDQLHSYTLDDICINSLPKEVDAFHISHQNIVDQSNYNEEMSNIHAYDGEMAGFQYQPPVKRERLSTNSETDVISRDFNAVFNLSSISPGTNAHTREQQSSSPSFIVLSTQSDQSMVGRRRSGNEEHIRPSRVQTPTASTSRAGSTTAEADKQHGSVDISGYLNAATVQWYFTKQAKSAGADIVGFIEDDRKRIINITFTDTKVVRAILSSPHQLEGRELTIVQATRKKPRLPRELDRRCLMIHGVPPSDDDHLSLFIQTRAKLDEDPRIRYIREGVALVRFQSEMRDVDQVIQNIASKTFKGVTIKAERVFKPDIILITGFSSGTHADTIRCFFDRIIEDMTKTYEEHVCDVKIISGNQALVFLNDHTNVGRILRMNPLKFNSTDTLQVEPHHDFMTGLTDVPTSGSNSPESYHFEVAHGQVERTTKTKSRSEALRQDMTRPLRPQAYHPHHEEIITIPEHMIEQIQKEVPSVSRRYGIHLSGSDGSITKYILRGKKEDVTNAKKHLEKLIREVDDDGYATPEEGVIETPPLQSYKMKQLEMCRIIPKIQRKHPNVKITVLKDENKVQFEGNESTVTNARVNMMELFESLVQNTPNLNRHQCQFVVQADDTICETFMKRSIRASCVESNTVKVKAETEADAQRACQFLEDEIKYENISCSDATRLAVLQDNEGQNLIGSMNEELPFALTCLRVHEQCVEIAGFRDDVQQARERINRYIEGNVATAYFIPLPEKQVKYLQKLYGTSEIQPLVTVAWKYEEGSGIMLKGKQEDCKKVEEQVRGEVQKIVEKSHPVSKAGIRVLLSEQGFLTPIEKDHNSSIEISGMENPSQMQHQSALPNAQRPQVLKRYQTKTGQAIEVCCGDLTKEQADVIVNAANTHMQHGSGVAGAIIQAGGQSIQDECNRIMQSRGHDELSVSQLIVTESGTLPFKKIIHVVGPIWEGGSKHEEDDLFDCILKVNEEANTLGMTSIAIPAISSGLFHFPVKLCARTMVESTCQYYITQPNVSSIRTIRFTDISQDTCRTIIEVLDRSPYMQEGQSTEEETVFQTPQSGQYTQISHDTIRGSSGGTIRWKIGNLEDEMVDSMVNSVGVTAELSHGGVSKAMLDKAGPALQREVKRRLGGNEMDAWDHIKTSSYNLQCQEVYHFHCQGYDFFSRGQNKNFSQSLIKLMTEANNSGMTSIALPAIGTGNLGYPPKTIAEVMYGAATTFLSRHVGGTLKDIRFVLYHKDYKVIKAFESEMQKVLLHGSSFMPDDDIHGATGPGARPKLKPGDTKKMYTDFRMENNGVCSIKIGNMFVELTEGNIVHANTDVIVNCTSPTFDLTAPLSKAIIDEGGTSIVRECQQLGPGYLLNEGVAMTSAGRFRHTQKIAHLLINREHDSITKLKDRMEKALKKAEENRMKTIAVPAAGTGNPKWQHPQVAEAMFKAIGSFAASNPQHLLLVKIIIYNRSLLHHYKFAMQSEEGKCHDVNRMDQMRRFGKKMKKNILSGADEAEEAIEQPDTVIFHILAGSNIALDATVEAIKVFIGSEFQKEEMPYDKRCGPLTSDRQRRINAVARKHQTSVECLTEENRKSSRLIIRGKKTNVNETKIGILGLLNQFHFEEKDRIEKESLTQKIQWRFQDEWGQFHAYDADVNHVIETAYQRKKSCVELDLEGGKVRIDFTSMEETSVSSFRQGSKVYRADLMKEAVDRLPTHWDPSQANNALVEIRGGDEYDKVHESFYSSLGTTPSRGLPGALVLSAAFMLGRRRGGSGRFAIKKIQRIQNIQLWKQYMAKKDTMNQAHRSGQQLERDLFHGTSSDALKHINSTGFNRSFHGKNGIAYGRGTYFAREATYSARFGPRDQHGNRYMYRCKVLTGDFTKGEESMIVPPPNNDSVVDNPQNPGIFVVFYDAQAYPEYLITYHDV